jgi:hypothetical protein
MASSETTIRVEPSEEMRAIAEAMKGSVSVLSDAIRAIVREEIEAHEKRQLTRARLGPRRYEVK